MVSMCALLLALCASAIAVPLPGDWDYQSDAVSDELNGYQSDAGSELTQCAISCPDTASSKFSYTPGQTYEYRYDSDTKTNIPGSTEHSSLHMRASVQIEVISKCEMVLRLTDVSLQDSDPTKYESRQHVDSMRQFKQSLENKPLRFAFIDGSIDNICPSDGDEVWALNVKRGILSSLQNTMTTLQGVSEKTEIDVSGNCPVKYEMATGMSARKLKKTKNLLACTDRSTAQTVFQSVGYDSQSDLQTMPLMRSTHECEQDINSKTNIVTRSECTETHVFRPFSRATSGATTEIKYKIVFQRQMSGTQRITGSSRIRTTLLYDHTLSDAEMTESVRDAQATMTSLCRQTATDVRPDAPALFSALVKQMRRLDTKNLKQLLTSNTKSPACAKAQTFYHDALPVLGTSASVAVIRDLVARGQVNAGVAELLLTSIAFIKKPTLEMIKELQPLLVSDLERAVLPISALVNTYCKLNTPSSPEVELVIKTLEDQLRYNCKIESDAQTARTLLALRAIGNAGQATRVAPTLSRCAMNGEALMAVRVAAINAFRRMECSASRDDIFRLLESRQADAELRINAYLAVMQCADEPVVERIRVLLESEEINQVGSFIWTHLTNLAETSSPMKAGISAILQEVTLQKEFDVDKRKFSRNIELSAYSELLNIGASVDSNLIWSAGSYIPRSASLNLTVDMFGQSVNLLEVGGRAQGLEAIMERYFGPGKEFENAVKREKRAVIRDEALTTIDRRFPKSRDATQLSYYLRVFGNEIRSGDIYNIDTDAVKNRFNILDLLTQMAQDRSVDFTRSFAFLDSNLVIPTGVGMPLRLGVEGTVTVALTANGKIDIRKIMTSPSNFDVTGSVRPSAALEVRAEFGIDAYVTRTQLRITNTLHTSTLLDGRITLKDGQVFNADWNMPTQKMEIFSAESHFYISYRGQDREQMSNPGAAGSIERKKCTDPTWSKKIGLELCAELSMPGRASDSAATAMFPISGPAVAKIYMNKLDTYLGARFEASLIRSKTEQTDIARMSFTTPGSGIDRELNAEFKIDRANKDISLNVKSPWKKVALTGKIVDEPTLKRTTLRAVFDESIEYSVTAEVAIVEQRADVVKYTPNIKIVRPGLDMITLDGEMTYVKNKKVSGKLALKNVFREPITVEGSILLQDKAKSQKYDANIQFTSPILRGSVVGFVSNIQDNGNTWASRADVNYQYRNGDKQRIVVNHKLVDTSTPNLKSYSTTGSWTTTMWPYYNGNFALEEQFSPNSLRTKLEAGFDADRKIIIIQSGAFDFTGIEKKFNGMLKFELPYMRVNYETKLDHIHTSDMLQSNVTVKYDENKEATVDIGLKKENTRYLSVLAEAKLKLPGRPPMTLTNKLTERAPREYVNELNVAAPGGINVRANTLYKMALQHDLTTDIAVTGLEPISIKGHFNPNLKALKARASVKYGAREYLTDINWTHRASAVGFNTLANVEMGCSAGRFGLTAEVTRRGQEFSANIEARGRENRKISLVTSITAIPNAPKAQARLEWPGSFVEVTSSGKIETQNWLSTTNDLEAALKVTSSIPRFEEMGASLKIDVAADSFKSSGSVAWAPDQQISGDVFYDKTKAIVNLSTPFTGYRIMKGESSYVIRGKALTSTNKLTWDTNTISLNINGAATLPAFNGKITFTSPFRNFEQLSTGAKNSLVGNKYQTSADVSWAVGRQIAFATTVTPQYGPDNALSIIGEASITTPFTGYRLSKVTWSHQHDYTDSSLTWKCHHELQLDGGKKYVIDIDESSRPEARMMKHVAKATFTSPISGWEKLSLTWDSMDDRRINSKGKGTVSWGTTTISLDHEVNIDPSGTWTIKVEVATPYHGYEVMGVDMSNRYDARKKSYTMTNEISLGSPRSKINLDGSLSFNGPTFESMLRLKTPYENMRLTVANLSNKRADDGSWATHADFEYAPDKTFTIDGKLMMDRTYGVELSMTSPFQYMKSSSFKAGATIRTARNGEVYAEVMHNMLSDKIRFEASADVESMKLARIAASLKTPFPAASKLVATATHDYNTPEKCTTAITYEFNELRGKLGHEQNIRSWADFNGKTRIEYISGRVIELDTKVSLSDLKSSITATLTTPFPSIRHVVVALGHDGSVDNYKANAEVTYNRRDKTSIDIEHSRDGGMSAKTSVKIVTPYSPLRRFVITGEVTPTSLSSEMMYEGHDKRFYIKREMRIEGKKMTFNGRIETPFEQLRTLTVDITHDPSESGELYKNGMAIKYNEKEIVIGSEVNLVGPTGKFSLRTPYDAVRTAELVFAHSTKTGGRNGNGWSNTGSIELNGKRTTSELEYVWLNGGKQLRSKAIFMLPSAEEYSFNLNHKVDRAEITTGVTVKLGGSHTMTASFKKDATRITCAATIVTPIKQLTRIDFNFQHVGPVNDFTTTTSISIEENQPIAAELKYKGDPNDFASSLKVDMPYTGLKQFTIAANHKLTDAELDSGASITYDDKKISAAAKYRWEGQTVRASFDLTTPFDAVKSIAGEITHTGRSWNDFQTSGKLDTSFAVLPSATFSSSFKAPNYSNVRWTGEVGIPDGKITTSYTHAGTPTDFKCTAVLTTPYRGYERFEAVAEHQGSVDGSPITKFTVKTPFRGYETLALNMEKTGDWNNFSFKAELIAPLRHAVSWSHVVSPNFEMKGQIETPYRGWERAGISASHTGGVDNFKTSAGIETPFTGYEKIGATVTHAVTRRMVKSTGAIETTIPGYQRFGYSVDYSMSRKGFKTIVGVETPVRGYDKFGGTVDYLAGEGNAFKTSTQLSTPIQGYKLFSATINHSGDTAQFETSGRIVTPFSAVPQIDYALRHRGASLSDFSTSASAEYSGKKITVETMYKLAYPNRLESNYEGSFKIVSPCPYVRDLSVTASHNRKPEMKSGAIAIVHNGEKKLDFDYSYATGGERNININIRDPYPMATNLNYGGTDGSAVVNWDTARDDKKIRFDFSLKNVVTSSLTDRSVSFKTSVARRTVGFGVGYTLSEDKFTNKAELLWDSDPQADFIYEMAASRSLQRNQQAYDGSFKVTSDLLNVDASLTHKTQPGRKHSTEVTIQTGEKLTFKNDVTFGKDITTHSLIVSHPRFARDVSVVTELANGNALKTTLTYERDSVTMEGRLIDESVRGESVKYSGLIRLAHPNSFTDVQLDGDVYSDDEKMGANLKGQYQTTADRQMKTAALRSEINRIRRGLSIELTTPFDTMKLVASNRTPIDSEWGALRYDVIATSNQINYRSSIDVSTKDRSCDVKLYFNNDDYVEMFGQVVSVTQASFDLSRFIRGQRINDASASLSLTSDRMLTGSSYVRPALMSDIRALAYSASSYEMPRPIAAAIQEFGQSATVDFNTKARYLRQSVAPIQSAVAAITSDINAKIYEMQSAFNAVYQRNDFYLRDIHQALQRHYEDMTRRMQYKMVELRRSYVELSDRASRYARIAAAGLEERTREWRQSVMAQFATAKANLDDAAESIKKSLMDSIDYLRSRPWFQAAMKRLATMQFSDFFIPPAELLGRMRAFYEQTLARLDATMNHLTDRPELRQARDWVFKTIQENKWMYEYLGLEQQVGELMQQARALTWVGLRTKASQMLRELLKLENNRWTVWDPEQGRYTFQIYLPFDLPDLYLLRRLEVNKYITYVTDMLERFVPDEDWNLLDTLYSYKPASDPRDWVPPFKAHASLTGSQHFMTFDRKFFEYAGECSYLLTRDFIDKTFSVIVNYDKIVSGQPTKKSITVMCDGKQIEVFPDAKITLDGTRVEMPIRVGGTTVSRNGNSISVINERGFEVTCDLPHDHCSVTITGWYYGKTGGLFGTYDNEPSNDFTTADQAISDKPETMADSWTVGTKCKPLNRALTTPDDEKEDSPKFRLCAEYFRDQTSTFRTCFARVDPEPFLQMCVNDKLTGSSSRPDADMEGVCRVAAVYAHECRRREAHVRMPTKCVRCEVPFSSTPFYESESKTLSGDDVPKTADVVFVIQHATCNKDLIGKVKGLVDDMDKALKSERLRNSRFAVVGYGGMAHLARTHVHTMDGQIFNSADKIPLALNRFELEGGETHDAMSAVRYAARLPFRAGASKTVVLVPCDSCTEETTRYGELQRILLQGDIRLHVLVQEPIILKSKSPKTAYIFGADGQTVYTRKDVAGDDLAGEADLRKYVRLPKDLCVALTQDTDGAIFSARQWLLDSRPMIQKRFADVMVRTIARKAAPTDCQVCECIADDVGAGMAQCRSCTQKLPMPKFYDDEEEKEVVVSRPSDTNVEINEVVTPTPTKAMRTRPSRRPVTRRTLKPKVVKIAPTRVPANPKVKQE